MRPLLLLALAALSSPAFASAAKAPARPDPALEQYVERWIQGLGGRDSLAHFEGAILRGSRIESGIVGQTSEWVSALGWKRVVQQGPSRSENTSRDTVCWERDWNQHRDQLDGRDRAQRVSEAWLRALLYAGTARDLVTNHVARVTGPDTTGRYVVLRCTPRGGAPMDLMLDRTTGLPAFARTWEYGDTVVTTIDDWRAIEGARFPFRLVVSGGPEGNRDSTLIEAITPATSITRGVFDPPPESGQDYEFAAGNEAPGIPFNFENDHVMVEVSVNGRKPIWFLLDTGADLTIINRSRLAEFGLEAFGGATTSGGGNATSLVFTRVESLAVGGVMLRRQRVGVIDVHGLERIYGVPLGGLLGYDFFSRFVVVLDYGTKTMDLRDPEDFIYRGTGTRIPFLLEGRQPHVRATLRVPKTPAIAADMIVDVGAADNANLNSPFVRANDLLAKARKTPASSPNTLPGSEKEFFAQTSVRGRLESLAIGKLTLSQVPVNLMVSNQGAYGSVAFSGTIGEGILRRFRSTYDYSRRTLIVEPDSEFAKPFTPRRTFGATLLSEGPDFSVFRITGVRKDSPADSAGLEAGDVIVGVDGKPATSLRLVELRKLLSTDGAQHVLEVKRGEAAPIRISITVRLISLDES